MAKSKVFWLTRDDDNTICAGRTFLWCYRAYPKKNKYGSFSSDSENSLDEWRINYEPPFFAHITLAPGQRVKARLIIQE